MACSLRQPALQRILQNETIFTLDELNKLESAYGLTVEQVRLVIETMEYMFLQAAYHLIKPALLESDLINEQHFEESRVRSSGWQWQQTNASPGQGIRRALVCARQRHRWTLEDISHCFAFSKRRSSTCHSSRPLIPSWKIYDGYWMSVSRKQVKAKSNDRWLRMNSNWKISKLKSDWQNFDQDVDTWTLIVVCCF